MAFRFRILVFSLCLSSLGTAQDPEIPCYFGYFEPAFDHQNNGTYQFSSATWNWIQANHAKGSGTGFSAKFNAQHVALIPTPVIRNGVNLQGKVFVMPYGMWNSNKQSLNKTLWSIIAPESSNKLWWNFQFDHPSSDPAGDLSCSAHSWDEQGKLFVFGGTTSYNPILGSKLAYVWDPTKALGNTMWVTNTTSPMKKARWYPSVTRVRDVQDQVKFIVTGGDAGGTNTYEAYDPTLKIWDTHGISQNRLYPGPTVTNSLLGLYPRQHLLSNGELFIAAFFQ